MNCLICSWKKNDNENKLLNCFFATQENKFAENKIVYYAISENNLSNMWLAENKIDNENYLI